MIKIVIGDKSADVTAEGWQAVREGLDRYFDGILALERAIGISPLPTAQETPAALPVHDISRAMLSTTTTAPPPPIPRAIPRTSTEKTIVEYAVESLNYFGNWTTLDELVSHMAHNGWKTTATTRVSRNSTVRNAMRDKSSLVQSQGHLWGLATWPVFDYIAPFDDSDTVSFDGEKENTITLDDMFPEDAGDQHIEKNNLQQNGVENELGPNFGRIL
jgi:hypothetical protein